jgi:uncharacterized protein YndB with AHSA1/START domain
MSATPRLEHKGRVIRTELRTTAPPEHVWAAWTDPARIAQWFTDGAEGEPRAGTIFWWIFDRFGYRIPYQVLEAIPNERFVLKGEMQGRPPGILEITIRREGGRTVMTLVNSGFLEGAEWDEEFQGIDSGWNMATAALKLYLENYYGQPKTQMLAMRPAQFTMAQLGPYYRRAEHLAKWLTASGGIGPVGSPCALVLRGGMKVTGIVLVETGREVAVTWNEIRGTLELKAFSMGPDKKMVCLRGVGWGLDAARAKSIEEGMSAALGRLAAAL